jgi:hypothetical protein
MVFDAINTVVGSSRTDTIGRPDFFITGGDNIYPADYYGDPTQDEWKTMLSFFQRPNLKDLPVYAVRGNHDAMFDSAQEVNLNSQWQLPANYYQAKLVPAGNNGELMGIMFIDSLILLCADYVPLTLNPKDTTEDEIWMNDWYDSLCKNNQEAQDLGK